MSWKPSNLPYDVELETKIVLKKLTSAHRALAELKGLARSLPQQDILINMLTFQEAKDSSEVENIVTTHDELYKSSLTIENYISPATKEVQNYGSALKKGYDIVKTKKILTINTIIEIQSVLEKNYAGLRKMPGTNLKNQKGEIIFEPPQDSQEIISLMSNLEKFINDTTISDYDPIIKMAIIHFQFESIHPFYNGNGRTGRIINILYLVLNDLLDLPILYLSNYIIKNKSDYYRLLQEVRDSNNWEEWLLYMIEAVEKTAQDTIILISKINNLMINLKYNLRDNYKFYSHELLNHLFKKPYTKIEFLMEDLNISRITASSYLNQLTTGQLLIKHKIGKTNYYVNNDLIQMLTLHNSKR